MIAYRGLDSNLGSHVCKPGAFTAGWAIALRHDGPS